LVGERLRLDGGRGATEAPLKLGCDLGLASLDRDSATGPPARERGADAADLPDGNLATDRVVPVGELDSQARDQLGLDAGVVVLGGCHLGRVQQATVEGEPASVLGLHFVADGHVSVEIGVAGSTIAMREGRGDETTDLDLPHAAAADAGVRDLPLQPRQRVGNGSVVCHADVRGNLFRRQRPQGRNGLDRREGEIEPGDRAGRLA